MNENFEVIKSLDRNNKILLIKNIQNDKLYVKKILAFYEIDVYEYLAKNSFSNIPIIIDYWLEDNKLIVIEEYIKGLSLDFMIENGIRFNDDEIKDIVSKLCKILINLNKDKKIVHRDIKPSNIIVKNSDIYLVDFNASKFVNNKDKDTVLIGTEGYAAPEQYGFGSSNNQSDIYSIGVLMKELLTGDNNLNNEYKSTLKPIIDKCTKIDPKQRYKDYDSLLNALRLASLSDLTKYKPVGFRSNSLFIKELFAIWYLLIIIMCTNLTLESATQLGKNALFVNRIGIFIILISITQFSGNYLQIQNKMKLNNLPIFIRIPVIIIIDIVILFLGLLIIAIFENI